MRDFCNGLYVLIEDKAFYIRDATYPIQSPKPNSTLIFLYILVAGPSFLSTTLTLLCSIVLKICFPSGDTIDPWRSMAVLPIETTRQRILTMVSYKL